MVAMLLSLDRWLSLNEVKLTFLCFLIVDFPYYFSSLNLDANREIEYEGKKGGIYYFYFFGIKNYKKLIINFFFAPDV